MIPPIRCWLGHAFERRPKRVGDIVRCLRCRNRYRAVSDGHDAYFVRARTPEGGSR